MKMNLLILCPKYIMWERKIQELRTQVGKIKPWKLYVHTDSNKNVQFIKG